MQGSDKTKRNADRESSRFLKLLHPDDSVFQVSAIGVRKPKSPDLWDGFASGARPIVSGWFRNATDVAAHLIEKLDSTPGIEPKGVYTSLNPVNPAVLSRSCNRLQASIPTTKDEDVKCLRHLLVDIDPARPADPNSSEEEHELSLKKGRVPAQGKKRC